MLLHVLELETTQDYQRMNLHPPSINLDVQQVGREWQKIVNLDYIVNDNYVEQQQRNLGIYLTTQVNLV